MREAEKACVNVKKMFDCKALSRRTRGPSKINNGTNLMVPSKGLEPPHRCRYMDLNHARLPIPPRWQVDLHYNGVPERTPIRKNYISYSTDTKLGVKPMQTELVRFTFCSGVLALTRLMPTPNAQPFLAALA